MIIPKIILYVVAGVMVMAILPLPYGFYSLIRLIATITFGILSYCSWRKGYQILPWLYGLGLLLFNPVFPIYLDKEIWIGLDVLSSVVILLSSRYL